ncbi:MAG: hypothetical protein R3E13_09270 [Alphaproteobacteria bacterium]
MDFSKLQQGFKALGRSSRNFDWRSLKKYAGPHAADDLNRFLEKLPQNTGQTMLVIAGVAWAAAGGIGLFTTVQMQKLTEIRAELQEAKALKPQVPEIKDVAVDAKSVEKFAKQMEEIYGGLQISASRSTITLTASSTGAFGQFREAIGHVQNGGSGWRVNIDRFCVGRECEKYPLYASLRINKVSVN